MFKPEVLIAVTTPERSFPGKSTDMLAVFTLSASVKLKLPGLPFSIFRVAFPVALASTTLPAAVQI